MNNKNLVLRAQILMDLLVGWSPNQISKNRHWNLNTILYHIKVLVLEGAVVRKSAPGKDSTPAYYKKGPNFRLYEPQICTVLSGPLSNPSTQTVPAALEVEEIYIDRAWFICNILEPWPEDHEWWEGKPSIANNMTKRSKRIIVEGKWALIEANNLKTLTIKLEPFYIPNTIECIRGARETAFNRAKDVVRAAARYCKMQLSLPVPIEGKVPYGRMNYEELIPELRGQKIGKIKISESSYTDNTPDREPHIVSSDEEEVIARHQAGSRILNLEKNIDVRLERLEQGQERIIEVMEKMSMSMEKVADTIEQVLKGPKDLKMKEMDELDNQSYR